MSVPHPIPYQGSKRLLAPAILRSFPASVDTLFEPFAGSAAITLAAAHEGRARRYRINDSLGPLAAIWDAVLLDPAGLADAYERIWRQQLGSPGEAYDRVRQAFNDRGGAPELLYLLARCVKGAVRFNKAGAFNQSPDNRRLGARPERMRERLLAAHRLLAGVTETTALDYALVLREARPGDLVYLDPPYQGTSGSRDRRYHEPLDRRRFIRELALLRERSVPFLVSFDGRTGARRHGPPLPAELGLLRIELDGGLSTQGTLAGRSVRTVESLYLSPELASPELEG